MTSAPIPPKSSPSAPGSPPSPSPSAEPDASRPPTGPGAGPAAGPTSGSRLALVLGEPFRARTWRRVAHILLAVPVGLVSLPLAAAGGPAGRLQYGLARLLPGVAGGPRTPGGPRAFAHALLALPLNVVALMATCYGWALVLLNLAWPLRPLVGMPLHAERSWGGPSVLGAWLVHAAGGGVTFLLAMPWICRGLAALQARLLTSVLGGRGGAAGTTVVLALLVAGGGAVLAVPVVHQL